MMKFDVLNRFTGDVQFTAEIDCKDDEITSVKLGLAVKWAIKNRASLDEASLVGARLVGARLDRASLVGKRPILQIGGLGSRNAYLTAYNTDKGIKIKTGCFSGSLEEFEDAVKQNHGDNQHGKEYAAAISMIKTHAEIWKP